MNKDLFRKNIWGLIIGLVISIPLMVWVVTTFMLPASKLPAWACVTTAAQFSYGGPCNATYAFLGVVIYCTMVVLITILVNYAFGRRRKIRK